VDFKPIGIILPGAFIN